MTIGALQPWSGSIYATPSDQFGGGVDVVIGRTGTSLCPVTAVVSYLYIRQDRPGAFFCLQDGTPVSKPWFITNIRGVLSSIGLPHYDYAGHSFRIGAATTAALAGVEDSTIQAFGRWQSAAFLQHIRIPQTKLTAISRRMATAGVLPPTPTN